ncbi:hypothetical protein [Streptomyces sp. NBC_00356]|uniref:hypothetical protein n=1 Tax=Streptomyces sp. NBC_00356 TaxID=2975724 RepID=UPI002E266428
MENRTEIIEQAAAALEAGIADTPDGQDPQAMADMLRTAHERGSLGAFAAFKTAQRILAAGTFEPAVFVEVRARARVRFVTALSNSGGDGEHWRTGTVVKATDELVMVVTDDRKRVILRADDWDARKVQQLTYTGGPS